MLPIVRFAMAMRDGGNKNYFSIDDVGHVARKDRTVDAPVSARPFSPEKWVFPNRSADMENLVSEASSQALLTGLVKKRRLTQFGPSLFEKLQPHGGRRGSSSAKTSSAGIDLETPFLNFVIRSRISRSQASSMAAVGGGSIVARIRQASVRR